MGETRDHLEEHGGPGMVWCDKIGRFIAEKCTGCANDLCPHWSEDDLDAFEIEPADQAEYFDWLGGAIRAGWL